MDSKLLNIDFVCVGFPKCGTTSLYSVLRQHSQIGLALGKETDYFFWCEKFAYPMNVLRKQFFCENFNIKKKHGLIESEFFPNAEDMKFYFGKDVKLIFMLRNPVDRLYSAFRMRLRQGMGNIIDLYQKHKHLGVLELFDIYCDEVICKKNANYDEEFETGNYVRWLKEFYKEFPKENILVLFLEDYKKDADKEICKMEQFLGVKETHLRTSKIANEGNQVSKNYYCARLNGFFNETYRKYNGFFVKYPKLGKWLIDKRNWVYYYTLKDDGNRLGRDTRKLCEQYYKASMLELGQLLGRDLTTIWFE